MTLTLGGEMLCASFDWINKLSEATPCYDCLHHRVLHICCVCYGCLHHRVLHICDLGCFTMSAIVPLIL